MTRFTFEAVFHHHHFELVMSDSTTGEYVWSADLSLEFSQYGTDDPHIMSDPPTDEDLAVSLLARGWSVVSTWENDEPGVRSADIHPMPAAYPQVTLPADHFERL